MTSNEYIKSSFELCKVQVIPCLGKLATLAIQWENTAVKTFIPGATGKTDYQRWKDSFSVVNAKNAISFFRCLF